MGNPIEQKIAQTMNNKNINGYVNLARMIRGANNPMNMISNLVSNIPGFGKAINLIKHSGTNPRDLYYNLAKEKGVDPDEFLKQFR